MSEIYVFLLCLSFFGVFLLFLKFYKEISDKRVEEFKDAFNKGYMVTHDKQQAFVEPSEPRVEYLSDEDFYHLEGGKPQDDEEEPVIELEDRWEP